MDGLWILFFLLLLAFGPYADRVKLTGPRKVLLMSSLGLTVVAFFFVFLLEHGTISSMDIRQVFGWLVTFLKMGAVASAAAAVVLPDLLHGKA